MDPEEKLKLSQEQMKILKEIMAKITAQQDAKVKLETSVPPPDVVSEPVIQYDHGGANCMKCVTNQVHAHSGAGVISAGGGAAGGGGGVYAAGGGGGAGGSVGFDSHGNKYVGGNGGSGGVYVGQVSGDGTMPGWTMYGNTTSTSASWNVIPTSIATQGQYSFTVTTSPKGMPTMDELVKKLSNTELDDQWWKLHKNAKAGWAKVVVDEMQRRCTAGAM